MQTIVVRSSTSLERKIECKVHEGSILEPIIFLIYVSEIKEFITNCMPLTYADDTVILFKSYTVDGLFAIMEITLAQLSSYLRMNRSSLNVSKTKYMIFSNIQHFETKKILSFGNVVIKKVTSFNYLGHDYGCNDYMVRSCEGTFH